MKMRWFQRLNLTFQDPAIEREFRSTQETNIAQDFDATAIALLLVTLSVVIERLVKVDTTELIIAVIMIAALLLFMLVRKVLKIYIVALTILMVIAYNAYRVIYLKVVYYSLARVGLWSGGYTYAILHMILIYRIPNIRSKILVVILAYLFRFLFLIFWIDEKSSSPYLLVRNIIVDAIIVYFYYTMERNNRRVFQYYTENRKELLKFKELLSDFPQSVTVIDFKEKRALFSNKTYLSTFETESPHHQQNIESVVTQAAHLNTDTSRPQLGSLRIDQASLGEIEALQGSCGSMELQNSSLYLKEVAEKLVKENLLKDQALTLTAAYKGQDQLRPFQVILKRVVWDRVDAVAVILNDITDQQNLITLKIANSNKDKYISTVSHEFRTPLHGIIGLLEITERETEKTEISRYISLCKDNAYLLLGMVNSILAFQQSTTGKLRLKLDRIDIREFMNNIIRLFHFQSDQKKIYLQSDIADEVPSHIVTDEQRLREIFIHLIGNAIKFTSKGGIRVQISPDLEDPRCLQMSVTDTGKGIREEELKDLFQFSWKMGVGETVSNKGVGLGLTVSNAWTLVLNGQTSGKGIQVASEYDKGSCFSFKILKELRVITSTETNITMRKLNSEGFKGSMERPDEIEVEFSPRIPGVRGGLEKPILADLSDKGGDSEYYEELLSPADLESKLSIYISRNKSNLQDLNFQFRHSKSYLHEMMELKSQQRQKKYDSYKSPKGDAEEEGSLKQQSRFNSPQKVKYGTVLVVDDNPFNLLIASNILKDLGYQVRTVMGGREAIEEARACFSEGVYLKLILMDCQMPIIDGYETTRILRGLMHKNEIQRVPILAWTANDSQEDVDRCFECGMIGHLTKPTSKDTLLKALIRLE